MATYLNIEIGGLYRIIAHDGYRLYYNDDVDDLSGVNAPVDSVVTIIDRRIDPPFFNGRYEYFSHWLTVLYDDHLYFIGMEGRLYEDADSLFFGTLKRIM